MPRSIGILLLLALAGMQAHAASQDHLVRGNFLEPESLDPHVSRGVEASNILRDLYEGLLREGPDGKLLPGVARSWTTSDNGRAWRFELREDARWSDGSFVTAGDFVFALRRAVSPQTLSPFADSLGIIRNASDISRGDKLPDTLGVIAVDESTLRIELEQPAAYLPSLLAHHSAYPLHRASLREHGDAFTRPGKHVGNGAYRLVEWKVNERITLERNPHYWDSDNVAIARVSYLPIDDEEAEFNRFRAGEIDITQTIPLRRLGWIREHLPDALRVSPYLSTYFYGFNLSREPFADSPGLRRALSMVIDRDIIANKVLGAGELPAHRLVPPGIEGHQVPLPDYAGWDMKQRIATARRLLAEAGYGPDRPLEIELRFNTGDNHRRVALAVASMWQQHLGVKTRLVNEEWKVFIQNRRQKAVTEVFRSAWVGDFNDPITFLQLLAAAHPLNDYGYASKDYDDLLAQAAAEGDPDQRRPLLQQAESLMLSDQPVLPLYYYVSKHLVAPRVGGWQANLMDHHATRDLHIRGGND